MLYHVTPSENVENILKVGLLPRIGAASQQNHEECPRVYLFTSLYWVKESIETWLTEVYWDKDLSVLSINASAEEIGGIIEGGAILFNALNHYDFDELLEDNQMSRKFTVIIKEIVTETFEIEAENENDAVDKGIQKYKACEWVLEPGELEEAKIAIINEQGIHGAWETIVV